LSSENAPLPRISESVLKHKKSLQQIESDRRTKRNKQKKKTEQPTRIRFTRAEKYVKQYRCQNRTKIRMDRASNKKVDWEEKEKIVLVLRVRKYGETPKVRSILQYMKVSALHSAAFMQYTPTIAKFLQMAEPFVAWGFPTLETVRELVYKRGHGKINGQRVPLTDNTIIESALGKWNVVCTEDIVHELFNCGPAFKHVSKFLWSFKLNPAHGAFIKDVVDITECGNHGQKINDLIKQMN